MREELDLLKAVRKILIRINIIYATINRLLRGIKGRRGRLVKRERRERKGARRERRRRIKT